MRHARAYYNEHDERTAAWLRELIARGLIADGDVDTRSIAEVTAVDLRGYTQCHFFAGVGGWSHALRLAGWPDTRPVWTGSCPCQPFSAAGKGLGEKDERHLWPVFFELIRQCRPEQVFGEQVASAIGKGWLDGVCADLEGEGYACGAVVLGAHSVGAPHLRQRLYWVADAELSRRETTGLRSEIDAGRESEPRCASGGMADASSDTGPEHVGEPGRGLRRSAGSNDAAECRGHHGGLADSGYNAEHQRARLSRRQDGERQSIRGIAGSDSEGIGRHAVAAVATGERVGESDRDGRPSGQSAAEGAGHGRAAEPAGFWSDSRFILCRDGKLRRIPTERALFPLADGLPYKLARRRTVRPALLRGAGNAIVPQDAAEFIGAWLEGEQSRNGKVEI